MDYILNTFLAQLPSINNDDRTTMEQTTTTEDLDMFLVGLPWEVTIKEDTAEAEIQGRSLHDLQNMDNGEVKENEHETEAEREAHAECGFDVQAHDKDSGYSWNIRDDYEEKDHVYYMPEGTYRSYEPYYWKNDEADLKGEHERKTANVDSTGLKVEADDKDYSCSWKIRSGYEELDHIYRMPSETYRSCDSYYWKKEDENEEEEQIDRASETDSLESLTNESDCVDFSTPKTLANIPHTPRDINDERFLCRVCRIFHQARKEEDIVSHKRCFPIGRKHLFRRKKEYNAPCPKCGCGVDRRSLLKRILGLGRTHGGI